MGKLVKNSLADFSDLAGKSGVLTCHQKTHFHKTYALRAAAFNGLMVNVQIFDHFKIMRAKNLSLIMISIITNK